MYLINFAIQICLTLNNDKTHSQMIDDNKIIHSTAHTNIH